jgi:hypothetical protein
LSWGGASLGVARTAAVKPGSTCCRIAAPRCGIEEKHATEAAMVLLLFSEMLLTRPSRIRGNMLAPLASSG